MLIIYYLLKAINSVALNLDGELFSYDMQGYLLVIGA